MGLLRWVHSVVELAGWVLVVWAAWKVSEPLGMVVLGLLLIVAGATMSRMAR